ncbi:hypothetical protein LJY25_02415 [Hymenobacter sp. BT175]|uniref:hypothetical protein n=1 Tax=Hymenobacter translucens TaxID=2886507 RepID=UPI001D0F47F3|nr:hypothetical protein [Hymenobacter translucens]MCC2545284.1 hypothetical protein [Hymenobacter translucens]
MIRFAPWFSTFLLAAVLTGAAPCLAQKAPVTLREEQTTVDALRAATATNNDTYLTFNHQYKGVKGSPYLLPGWQKADLRLQNNQLIPNVPVKYDVLGNNLLAIRKPNDSIIVGFGQVKEFTLRNVALGPQGQPADHLFRRCAFLHEGKVVDNYFEVLAEGRGLLLLKRIRKEVRRFNRDAATVGYSSQSGFDEIDDKTEYYLFAESAGKAELVKLSRRGLDKSFQAISTAGQPTALSGPAVRTEQELVVAFQLLAAQ